MLKCVCEIVSTGQDKSNQQFCTKRKRFLVDSIHYSLNKKPLEGIVCGLAFILKKINNLECNDDVDWARLGKGDLTVNIYQKLRYKHSTTKNDDTVTLYNISSPRRTSRPPDYDRGNWMSVGFQSLPLRSFAFQNSHSGPKSIDRIVGHRLCIEKWFPIFPKFKFSICNKGQQIGSSDTFDQKTKVCIFLNKQTQKPPDFHTNLKMKVSLPVLDIDEAALVK